jgi:hypothetical protein
MAASTQLTPDGRRSKHAPKNKTPEWRTERASNAGKASQAPETLAIRLVRHWPALSPETQATIRQALKPVINGGANG